jgi:hypothetical protein
MAYLIDVLGSAVIGGMVILLTISINLQMNDLSEDIFMDSIVQGNATSSASDFKYDLYKIGYGVTGNKFITADSTNLYYYSDFNNDGTIDSIQFSLGPTDSLSGTTNPNDRPLYRTLNGSSANKSVLLIVNKFEFIEKFISRNMLILPNTIMTEAFPIFIYRKFFGLITAFQSVD